MNTERDDLLSELLKGGKLDDDVIRRLAAADLDEMRASLSALLPDDEVEQIIERVKKLRAATQ
jgi:hypothetical protein